MIEDSTSAGIHSIRCPLCEVYELERLRDGSARCTSCRGTLDAKVLSTILVIDRQPAPSGQLGIARP